MSPQLTTKPYNQLRPCRCRLPPQHRDVGQAVTAQRNGRGPAATTFPPVMHRPRRVRYPSP